MAGIIVSYTLGIESHWLWIASFALIGMPHGAYDVWRLRDQSQNPLTTWLKIALHRSSLSFLVAELSCLFALSFPLPDRLALGDC